MLGNKAPKTNTGEVAASTHTCFVYCLFAKTSSCCSFKKAQNMSYLSISQFLWKLYPAFFLCVFYICIKLNHNYMLQLPLYCFQLRTINRLNEALALLPSQLKGSLIVCVLMATCSCSSSLFNRQGIHSFILWLYLSSKVYIVCVRNSLETWIRDQLVRCEI